MVEILLNVRCICRQAKYADLICDLSSADRILFSIDDHLLSLHHCINLTSESDAIILLNVVQYNQPLFYVRK